MVGRGPAIIKSGWKLIIEMSFLRNGISLKIGPFRSSGNGLSKR